MSSRTKPLTFQSEVSVVGDAYFKRHPLDLTPQASLWLGGLSGAVAPTTDDQAKSLNLPIVSANNTPEAVREIVEASRPGEDVNSPLAAGEVLQQGGLFDYYCQYRWKNHRYERTSVSALNEILPGKSEQHLSSTHYHFTATRGGKLVRQSTSTSEDLRTGMNKSMFGGRDVMSIYVDDQRILPSGELAAVRLRNGMTLPPSGLTVATARPLYVLGNYNQTSIANLGTSNTTTTLPASLVADAITILSGLGGCEQSVPPAASSCHCRRPLTPHFDRCGGNHDRTNTAGYGKLPAVSRNGD